MARAWEKQGKSTMRLSSRAIRCWGRTWHTCMRWNSNSILERISGIELELWRQEKSTQIRLHEVTLLQDCRALNTAGDQRYERGGVVLRTYHGSINTMVPLTHQSPDTPSASALAWTTYSSVPIIDSSLDLLTYLLYPYELSMLVMTRSIYLN